MALFAFKSSSQASAPTAPNRKSLPSKKTSSSIQGRGRSKSNSSYRRKSSASVGEDLSGDDSENDDDDDDEFAMDKDSDPLSSVSPTMSAVISTILQLSSRKHLVISNARLSCDLRVLAALVC